jgi:hypothetical protein
MQDATLVILDKIISDVYYKLVSPNEKLTEPAT